MWFQECGPQNFISSNSNQSSNRSFSSSTWAASHLRFRCHTRDGLFTICPLSNYRMGSNAWLRHTVTGLGVISLSLASVTAYAEIDSFEDTTDGCWPSHPVPKWQLSKVWLKSIRSTGEAQQKWGNTAQRSTTQSISQASPPGNNSKHMFFTRQEPVCKSQEGQKDLGGGGHWVDCRMQSANCHDCSKGSEWPPTPKSNGMSRFTIPHIHQESMERFTASIMRLSGDSRAQLPSYLLQKWLQQQRPRD